MALARPTTTSLSFTDPDLSDTYADSRSTTSHSTTANRHPRGDSPLCPSRSLASTRGKRSGDTGRELPNLSTLLAFLDEDEDHNTLQHSLVSPPRSLASASRHIASPPRSIVASAPLRTSTPPFPAPLEEERDFLESAGRKQSRARSALSFSTELRGEVLRSGMARGMSSGVGRGLSELGREGRGGVGRVGPESPSPRPGSASLLLGRGKGKGREGNLREEQAEERREGVARSDSVTRLADQVMAEFETIISRGSPVKQGSQSRPLSRLRNIPSPSLMSSIGAKPVGDVEGEEKKRDTAWRALEEVQRMSEETWRTRRDSDGKLREELEDANSYIARLQSDLREINSIVFQLRNDPPVARHQFPSSYKAPHPAYAAPSEASVAYPAKHASNDDAWEVARHILNLLPTFPTSPPPTMHSLTLALQFTRSVDALVHLAPGGGGRGERRDELVFEEGNLESVLRRVRGWERAVRRDGS